MVSRIVYKALSDIIIKSLLKMVYKGVFIPVQPCEQN